MPAANFSKERPSWPISGLSPMPDVTHRLWAMAQIMVKIRWLTVKRNERGTYDRQPMSDPRRGNSQQGRDLQSLFARTANYVTGGLTAD